MRTVFALINVVVVACYARAIMSRSFLC